MVQPDLYLSWHRHVGRQVIYGKVSMNDAVAIVLPTCERDVFGLTDFEKARSFGAIGIEDRSI